MSSYTRTIVYTSETAVNATAIGNTLITQTRQTGGPRFYALDVRVGITQSVNVQTPGFVSIGTNPPNYDNICAAQSLSGIDNVLLTFAINQTFTGVPELTDIVVRVSAPTTPIPATTATHRFRVGLVGIEL